MKSRPDIHLSHYFAFLLNWLTITFSFDNTMMANIHRLIGCRQKMCGTKISILVVFFCFQISSGSIAAEVSYSEAITTGSELNVKKVTSTSLKTTVFGYNLFQGSFKVKSQPYYNPNYRVAIGDTINLQIWGSLELALEVKVDTQGNIFIPKVGNILVGGVTNRRLIEIIKVAVNKKYNQRIFVYANVADYQPVWVFVTGNVNRPGLYQGMASDSVLQYIDKANGINLEYGSFRDVAIVRNNRSIKMIDLYGFLTAGRLDLFQFNDGDSIVVGNIKHQVTVLGDVKRPYRFEIAKQVVGINEILSLALPNPTATNINLTRWLPGNKKNLSSYSLDQNEDLLVVRGDTIEIFSDHNENAFTVSISGEHEGLHSVILQKGITLSKLLSKIHFTELSAIESIQLFRKSVADKQKQLLHAKLQELETLVLTTSSISKDEALMRSQEAKSILTFIDRAKTVQPKGQVVIHDMSNLDELYLEADDQVYIPRKSNVVLVQGEVAFPGAHTYINGKKVKDFISLSGDFSERANKQRVLVIKQNGRVVKCESEYKLGKVLVDKGDSILVLPKLDGKSLQITKDITQILYQIAVGAGVLLAI